MVTAASTAELAVVLVDARHGLQEQSRRHACIAGLLGIRHVVLAVNKMDLVDWDEARFDAIAHEFACLADALHILDVTPIPISALLGDNVVTLSAAMAWYAGPTLLEHLETVVVEGQAGSVTARLPVQLVIRGDGQRRYAGSVAGGTLRHGDEVVVLPSGHRTQVTSLATFDGPLAEATAPTAVTVTLADEFDVGRGDVLAAVEAAPEVTRELEATVCWFASAPLLPGARVLLKHTTRVTRAIVRDVVDRLDVNNLTRSPATELVMNDLGVVRIATATPLAVDRYTDNRATGSFVIIDETTNATIGAGMISTPTP